MPVGFIKKLFGQQQTKHGDVLIVDDDPTIRELLGVHLSNLGYRVTKAVGAEAAYAHAEKGKILFSLFVLDIRMNGEDGLSLAKRLRKLDGMSKTPIVFISGAFPLRELEKIREMVENSVAVPKPFSAKKLQEAIQSLRPAPARIPRRTKSGRLPSLKGA